MVEKKYLEQQIAHYDKLAQDNFQSYQESGIGRYYSSYTKYDDFASALRIALKAKDDHDELVSLRGCIAQWKSVAEKMNREFNPETAKKLMSEICFTSKLHRI